MEFRKTCNYFGGPRLVERLEDPLSGRFGVAVANLLFAVELDEVIDIKFAIGNRLNHGVFNPWPSGENIVGRDRSEWERRTWNRRCGRQNLASCRYERSPVTRTRDQMRRAD